MACPLVQPRLSKFDKRAFGIPKGSKVDTFIVARRDWSFEWELLAVRALIDAFEHCGLSTMCALRWQVRRPFYVMGGFETEATGKDAIAFQFAAIHSDAEPASDGDLSLRSLGSWKEVYFKWSSDAQRADALAHREVAPAMFAVRLLNPSASALRGPVRSGGRASHLRRG